MFHKHIFVTRILDLYIYTHTYILAIFDYVVTTAEVTKRRMLWEYDHAIKQDFLAHILALICTENKTTTNVSGHTARPDSNRIPNK
jgi:hypothetical protein